ncbi:hypothetical protein SEA_DINGER_66 [Rhodococcus phage Dinger]|uniref:Uncharacterized protein n=1 Tax=Rhodococcus phage Dinger TaxID=2708634 RepID=A0A6G6XTA1_9CAUD|nr:hypothetical protein SEA_DINGER_66 [Rhodococcus phage Dinger]
MPLSKTKQPSKGQDMTVNMTKASDYATKAGLTIEQDVMLGHYVAKDSSGTTVVELYFAEPDEFLEELRKATRTVREVMDEEYGDNWEQMDHLVSIANNYHTGYEDVMTINHATKNEIHGYDCYYLVANYETLYEAWGELSSFTHGPWSNNDMIALHLDEGMAPHDLVETLNALESYPVLDESLASEVEQRFIDEHWESYGKSDTLSKVSEVLEIEELSDAAEDIVTQLVWSGIVDHNCGGGYPFMIDDSAVEFNAEEIAEWMKVRLGTQVTYNHYGMVYTFDLRRSNLTWH